MQIPHKYSTPVQLIAQIIMCIMFHFIILGVSQQGCQSPVPNSYKLAAQLIVNILKERYCMWAVDDIV